jgi:hypothetical protein
VQEQAVFSNPCDFLREQEQLRAKIRQFHEGEGLPNRTYCELQEEETEWPGKLNPSLGIGIRRGGDGRME